MSRRFSDSELRNMEFDIDDPYTQEGLVDSIPPNASLVRVLNTYRFKRYPAEKVWCAVCKSYRHKFGFTAEISTGGKALTGRTCGQKVFGQSWDFHEGALRDSRRRLRYLKTLDQLAPRLLSIGTALIQWWPAAKRFDRAHLQFRTAMPELYNQLRREAREGGVLKVYVELDVSARKLHGGSKREWAETVFHRMLGREFFLSQKAEELIERAEATVKALIGAQEHSATHQTSSLIKIHRGLANLVDELVKFADAYEAMSDFFSETNLLRIEDWSALVDSIQNTYKAKGRSLVCTSTNKMVVFPGDCRPLDGKLLHLLGRAPTRGNPKANTGSVSSIQG